MSAYKIKMNFSDGREKWFSKYASAIDSAIDVSKNECKVFFTKSHAENCIKQFRKTCETNKGANKFKTKWDEFLFKNPTFIDMTIEEFEDIPCHHLIYFLVNGNKFYIKEFDLEKEEFSITPFKSKACQYILYDSVKHNFREIVKNGWFRNAEILIETIYNDEKEF